MKKIQKVLALVSVLAVCLLISTGMASAFEESQDTESGTVYSADTDKKLPDWIPADFMGALEFSNKYGKTHASDGVVCIVRMDIFRNSDIWLSSKDNGSTYDYEKYVILNEDYEYKSSEGSEQGDYGGYFEEPYFTFKVVVYEVPESETLSLSCGTFGGIAARFNKEFDLSFSADENGEITETDFYGWLPDSIEEYEEFSKNNDNVFIKDGYIVFHDKVSPSCGQELKDSYKGTSSAEKILDYSINMISAIPMAGGSSPEICVYKPVTSGELIMNWDIYGPSEQEPPIKSVEQAFDISDDLSVTMISVEEPNQIPESEYSGVSGDANNDGAFDVADLIALNRWIKGNYELAVPDICVDLNGDEVIDVFDVCKMRRMLIEM